MASSELRRRLTELAQQFVDGVIVAIQSVPLRDVAAEIGGNSDGRRLANSANSASVPGVSVVAPARRRGRGGIKAARSGAVLDGDKAARSERRSLVRRPGGEIEKLRAAILRSLKGASGPISASEIARQVGVKTAALAFPMAQLRKQGLVGKDGERTQAVYTLEQRGAATHANARTAKSAGKAKRGHKKK